MAESDNYSNDTQRIERFLERISDKVDNISTTLTLVQTTQAVQNTQIANIMSNAEKSVKEQDSIKLSIKSELKDRDARLDKIENSQSTMREKIAPILVIGTIVLSIITSNFTTHFLKQVVGQPQITTTTSLVK